MQKNWQGHRKKADTKTKGGNGGPIPDPTKVEGGTGDAAMWVARDTAAPPGSNDSGRREQTSQGGGIVC